jgi:hydroxymethylpyrimidine pyrophosphatase-like HAD family hydrolase
MFKFLKKKEKIYKYKNILARDFDGTIVEKNKGIHWKLRENAKEVINKLYEENNCIIIWTCRPSCELEAISDFLNVHKIKFHFINENGDSIDFKPSNKIYATHYIDDNNYKKEPIIWEEVYNYINKENQK